MPISAPQHQIAAESRGVAVRFRRVLLLVIAAVALTTYWCLFSDVGVFLVGHRYWFNRAVSASSEAAARANLQRVLGATQYGVNQAQNRVRALDNQADRIRMLRLLIAMAPNSNWQEIYSAQLQQEVPRPSR